MKNKVDLETMKHRPHRATPLGGGIYPMAGTVIDIAVFAILIAVFW